MNQEVNNNEELNNNVAPGFVQPTYTTPVDSTTMVASQPYAAPATPTASVAPQPYTAPTTPVAPQPIGVESKEQIDKVSNLNKEDAMEEALSHTNQFTPFEIQQEEVNQETNFMSNKKTLVFLGFILVIMLLFIIFLPQISKLMGW